MTMPTEVTLIIYDPYERGADWWWNLLADVVEEAEGEVIDADDEEV